jgi:hypothetical protein
MVDVTADGIDQGTVDLSAGVGPRATSAVDLAAAVTLYLTP